MKQLPGALQLSDRRPDGGGGAVEAGQLVSLLCGAVAACLGRFGVASGFSVK